MWLEIHKLVAAGNNEFKCVANFICYEASIALYRLALCTPVPVFGVIMVTKPHWYDQRACCRPAVAGVTNAYVAARGSGFFLARSICSWLLVSARTRGIIMEGGNMRFLTDLTFFLSLTLPYHVALPKACKAKTLGFHESYPFFNWSFQELVAIL